MRIRRAIWVASILVTFALTCQAASAQDVEQRFPARGKVDSLPLVVNTAEAAGKELFLTALRGIVIESIKCDGTALPAATVGDVYETVNARVRPTGTLYVYALPAAGRVVFFRRFESKTEEAEIASIAIPTAWNSLDISYRVRFADSSCSRTYRAVFSRLSGEEMERAQVEASRRIKEIGK